MMLPTHITKIYLIAHICKFKLIYHVIFMIDGECSVAHRFG